MGYGQKPHKEIDWDKVDKLIEAQNKAVEIAGHFNLSDERFCERLKERYGMTFTAYSASIYSKGKSNLRTRQYQKAMEGNIQMLLKLGEVYLEDQKVSKQYNVNLNIIEINPTDECRPQTESNNRNTSPLQVPSISEPGLESFKVSED